MRPGTRKIFTSFLVAAGLYLLLLIPDNGTRKIEKAGTQPFAWQADSLWNTLETTFINNKNAAPENIERLVDSLFTITENNCISLETAPVGFSDSLPGKTLQHFFLLASAVASQPKHMLRLNDLYARIRAAVKQQSQDWDINNTNARNQLYKTLYGMRAAVEEAALQDSSGAYDIIAGKGEHAATPFTNILGLKVHSGDLLVSRGGAEVSAFISRGNDYPGNFSHVALIYIEEKTNKPYLIEAHIEKGVAIASVEEYIKDKKLRFMVLRPRFDLPELQADSLLPQKAAKLAFEEAGKHHIPYDFKMNYFDSSAMFCSEVGSYAYQKNGLQLWKPVSTISSTGVSRWLNDFGVEYFVTQMPADLEYDPQLMVAGEWKDPETLFKDHADNAVMDALIATADQGKEIGYNRWMLPVVRILKGYCMILNLFGRHGKIPEGMSATQALKNQRFVEMFQQVKSATLNDAEKFMNEKKYRPPYWQLVRMAEKNAKKL
ncbi:MAG: YiiX/YebB-like N1pC/P60 family cysteine hydrolase [Ferruginibacter sp.]